IAVLIRVGLHVLGILSIDFSEGERGHCNLDTLRDLEDLAALYAPFLLVNRSNQLYAELEECFPRQEIDRFTVSSLKRLLRDLPPSATASRTSPRASADLYHKFLEKVAEALGVSRASVFRRDTDGLFRLVTSVGYPENAGQDHLVRPGEGFTG